MKQYWALAVLLAWMPAWVAAEQPASPEPPTVYLFYSPSCAHCHQVRALIKRLAAEHPALRTVEYNLSEPANIERMADYYASRGVPPERWGGTIAVFVGNRWWNDSDKILAELGPALSTMTPTKSSRQHLATSPGLIDVFRGFGVLTVAVAGLLDGINPCAIATLVFLLSYLSFAGRSSRQMLATGLLFAAGIFVAYLGVGLGAFRGLHMLEGFSWASRLLYPLMALGTLILAGYSFHDYLKARSGAVSDMILKLPKPLTRLSHRVVRSSLGTSAYLGFAFIAGLVISILELFCTGQIYLPTLMYIWGEATLRGRAFGLLVLYVAMFTLPIVVLALIVYAGVSSQKLAILARQHTAAVKLSLSALFILLTLYFASVSWAMLFA